jgi:hypothetical protein
MQSSLLDEPTHRNIKAADVADFAEVAKTVETETQTDAQLFRLTMVERRFTIAPLQVEGLSTKGSRRR